MSEANKRISNLVTVGRVIGVHGVKGWIKVQSFTETPEKILDYAPWWLKTRHGAKSFEVDEYQAGTNSLLVHLQGLDDRDQAKSLLPADIAVDKTLFDDLHEGDYYWHQLIGLQVESVFNGEHFILGKVAHLLETGANDVLVITPLEDSIDDKERLVPYVPDTFVKKVDLQEGKIWVDWDPEF